MIPKRLLPQSVTIRPLDGSGPYGPVFGTPYSVPARVEHENRLVRDSSGQEVVAKATAYLQPRTPAPPVGSDITLPDGTTRTIIAVAQHVGASSAAVVTVDTN